MVERISPESILTATLGDQTYPRRVITGRVIIEHIAAYIEQLERQIAELLAKLDEYKEVAHNRTAAWTAAEAENARLRALPLKDEVERVLDDASAIIAKLEERAAEDVMYDGRPVEKWCSEYVSIIDRLRAGEQEGWRPIETAPKDGTPILAFREPSCIGTSSPLVFVAWCEESQEWIWPDDTYDPYVLDSYTEAYQAGSEYADTKFTYWMPLPAAPSEQGGNRG